MFRSASWYVRVPAPHFRRLWCIVSPCGVWCVSLIRGFVVVAELLTYAKDVVRTHRLEEDGVLRLHHRVLEARWQDDIQR